MTDKMKPIVNGDKGRRAILIVDDDAALMHKYHGWMGHLSRVYHNLMNSYGNDLYVWRVYDIKDLDLNLNSILDSYDTTLDLVITDFDLITANGNDVARMVRAKFPDTTIVGNTGGSTDRFDKSLVDVAVNKIMDMSTLYDVIRDNTCLLLHSGFWDLFDRAKASYGRMD